MLRMITRNLIYKEKIVANSIKDGIINYSGTKYEIIGETDKLYIGFANVGPLPRICKINKDLTGGKSKQLPSQYFLDKAIIEDNGTIVVIGCIIERIKYAFGIPRWKLEAFESCNQN